MIQQPTLRVLDVCSGIGTTAVAWHSLGWQHLCFAEIEKFPSAVLRHRWPNVPNEGDFTKIGDKYRGAADLLVGGTPCQSFSVAGLRGGLADDRGNLALEFLRLADCTRPRWVVWENVPGVLSSLSHSAPDPCPPPAPLDVELDGQEVDTSDEYDSEELHAFNCFVAGLSELGYGWAFRILDAQHFGVPQRRRRVFVVGYLGDWRRAAAVLFERHSLQGHHPPRREKGQAVAPTIASRPTGGGGLGTDFDCDGGLIAGAVSAKWAKGTGGPAVDECYNLVTHSLRADGFDASEDGPGRGTPIIPILEAGARTGRSTDDIRAGIGIGENGDPMFTLQSGKQHAIAFNHKASAHQSMNPGEVSPTLEVGKSDGVCVAIRTAQTSANGHGVAEDVAHTLDGAQGQAVACFSAGQSEGAGTIAYQAEQSPTLRGASSGTNQVPALHHGMAVRRLTPLECERLQGLPDRYTEVPFNGKMAADGPRYKAIGNGMAVPVVRWIGERIQSLNHL